MKMRMANIHVNKNKHIVNNAMNSKHCPKIVLCDHYHVRVLGLGLERKSMVTKECYEGNAQPTKCIVVMSKDLPTCVQQ
jgi:hypothetical protein